MGANDHDPFSLPKAQAKQEWWNGTDGGGMKRPFTT